MFLYVCNTFFILFLPKLLLPLEIYQYVFQFIQTTHPPLFFWLSSFLICPSCLLFTFYLEWLTPLPFRLSTQRPPPLPSTELTVFRPCAVHKIAQKRFIIAITTLSNHNFPTKLNTNKTQSVLKPTSNFSLIYRITTNPQKPKPHRTAIDFLYSLFFCS